MEKPLTKYAMVQYAYIGLLGTPKNGFVLNKGDSTYPKATN